MTRPLYSDPTMDAASRIDARGKNCCVCLHRGETLVVCDVRLWTCKRGLVYPVRGRCGRMELDEG